MNIETMYPPHKDSPSTYLMGDIGTTDTFVVVGSTDILPQEVPFPLTLGFDKGVTETVLVTDLGNGNNQLTIVRGSAPLSWVAGTKCARVWTSSDVNAIQNNIKEIAEQTDENTSSIENNALIAEEALNSEVTRATNAESNLNANKVNRNELTVLITDVTLVANSTTATVTFTTYDANAQVVGNFIRYLPIGSNEAVGLMTPESYEEIIRLRTDVQAIQQQGGRFIGVSFSTYVDLQDYVVPSGVNVGDFTYVLDDESHQDATTRYIYNGTEFEFAYVINFDPVGIANGDTPGLVKSYSGGSGGKIFVEVDGTMSVVGWNGILESIANNVSANNPTITFQLNGTLVDSITLNQTDNKIINFDTTAGAITDIQDVLNTLANEHLICQNLQDSEGNYILDENDENIKGQFIFVIK